MEGFHFVQIFKAVIDEALLRYRPDVIVMQCGSDSLANDVLGHFNLRI